MDLIDNGTQIEIMTLNRKKKIINIKDIQASKQEHYKETLKEYGRAGLEMYPLHIGGTKYVIDKHAVIEN